MNPTGHNQKSFTKAMSRPEFLRLLAAALESHSFRFARLAALNWMAVFPGDLQVHLALGEAQLGEGKTDQAAQIFEKICALDPEYMEARRHLVRVYQLSSSPKLPAALANYYVLGGDVQWNALVHDWGSNLYAARTSLESKDYELAGRLVDQVNASNPDNALAAVTRLRLAAASNHYETIPALAAEAHTRWPECIQFKLFLAEAEIEQGNEASAVELLHQCVADDSAGQVAFRVWGSDHRYRPMWPERLEIYFDLPIPAPVAAKMGWNQLASGPASTVSPAENPAVEPVAAPAAGSSVGVTTNQGGENKVEIDEKAFPSISPETLLSVDETFGRLAKQVKKPALGRADGRCPVYVVLSTRSGLESVYGKQTGVELLSTMTQLTAVVNRRAGWAALVFLPDDVDSAGKNGCKAIDAVDPWKIKLALADLDKALAKKGQMIGALLIAGGPEVVPYHRLPNPTDDSDKDVPSDNPYGTLDSNYFIPEWPVGRLVGETSSDAGLLLDQLRKVLAYHTRAAKMAPIFSALIRWLLDFLKSRSASRKESGFGYTAEVWKESSSVVYRALGGDASKMLSSPPEETSTVPVEKVSSAELEYFNLHGIEDGADWYGQKDMNSTAHGPDYPVAIGPHNLNKNGHSPSLVFTEACYGANVINKKEDEAMALKFLAIGARVFVGSTTISYGSVAEPLIGADMLGSLFWKGLKEGLTAGEALMQAKVGLVREMTRRQGYLDGEDQKTLISFVLFGDPLLGYETAEKQAKSMTRYRDHPRVKMVCERQEADQGLQPISAKVLNEVKAAVAEYLPGLGVSEVVISRQRATCDAGHHNCLSAAVHEKVIPDVKDGAVVVTVSKKVLEAQHVHTKYARVTLNAKGKILKLAVSR